MPWRTSSAFSSQFTAASLLSERGFMPRTMKPREASSFVETWLMKLLVRWVTRKATGDASPSSGR